MIEKKIRKKVKASTPTMEWSFVLQNLINSAKMKDLCGIILRYTSQHNEVAERMNMILLGELGVCSLILVCQSIFGPRQLVQLDI